MTDSKDREKEIYRVTLRGSAINALLVVMKLMAGIFGHSAAMIADGIHSLSDFLTDIAVIVFVRLSSKPQDKSHDYGHGKYETLATAIIGIALLIVGLMILSNGAVNIWHVIHGEILPSPGVVAFVAAVVSIVLKEWCYRFTASTGRRVGSEALVANAWHHRSDALSSVGTAMGIGGAIVLGSKWTVLDPIAAMVVGVLIVMTALKLVRSSMDELLEKSLPDDVEDSITAIAESEPQVSKVHNLRTRRIGNNIAIEMHIRMPGDISLYESHQHAMNIERKLKEKYGASTHIGIHVEPLKVDGKYQDPKAEKCDCDL
jgi:cation diffusion facilitator family transporter